MASLVRCALEKLTPPCHSFNVAMADMKYKLITAILLAMTCWAYARDEVYVPDGFIGQSSNLIDDGIAIVSFEVSKWNGLEKPIDVKMLDVPHGTNALLEVTKIFDDAFDPIFTKKFEPGSKWILRIMFRAVGGKKQWMVSYYKTSHLQLVDDHVSGHILKHNEKKKMKYTDFKALLAKEIEKKKPDRTRLGNPH